MDAINLTYPIMSEMPENVRLSVWEYQAIAEEVLGDLKKGKARNVVMGSIENSLPHNVKLSSHELGRMADACQEAWDRSNGLNFVVKYWFPQDHERHAGAFAGSATFEVLAEAIEYKIRQENSDRVAKVYRLVEFEEVS
tara:strand:- start:5 stop:421 length:417 start_codon:yes stop_codon:yes gene_type:complete